MLLNKFDEYQDNVGEIAFYPNRFNNIVYPTLGLVGEAGEVAEKVKKILRDEEGIISDNKRQEIIYELGDVLWYLSALCDELDCKLSEVANKNFEKLNSREMRGKLSGDGDNR